ncbi:hypothetical protein KUTeg_021166 [Tegillarca granosa]|uniref:Gelsolin-like domain-containing protein n=1 Tax=Tegillarca granosa TaxID=220873 RepID=A0ABQ9E9Z9_TEGGR|nr:hypothetical protein KUTeg_021166 [Tegillarca granosa]
MDKPAWNREKSAKQEAAWFGAGQNPGLQIWRIVTYHKGNHQKLNYDVHVWIGKYSTPDEYGTACYKTAELDTFLGDVPVQHREVQGHESARFRSYFGCIKYLHGGADSGFRRVTPEKYEPRLLHFHGDKYGVKMTEVPRIRSKLDSTDVYILDLGLKIYQWNGKGSNFHERTKVNNVV